MDERRQAVTIRLDAELHREASAVAKLSGSSLRALVESGLRREVDDRLRDSRLGETVRSLARKTAMA